MERLSDYQKAHKWLKSIDWDNLPKSDENLATICEALQEIEKYKDLEEQNKLLRLPCAVGDTVYGIKKASYCPTGICKSEISCSKCRELAPYRIGKRKFKFDDLAEIGKTVFLTREEAEAALNEMERRKGK